MGTNSPVTITVEAIVQAPVESVWKYWTEPKHIMQWNKASDDWHTPFAENDLKAGGKFVSRMEAKDGSFGFDFGGVYDEVNVNKNLSYTLGDGRKVKVDFIRQDNDTQIIESFEAEETNAAEMQQAGWQAILDNFKKYAETAKEE
ncbi:SRPBCC family protein [Paenibacillus nasutitermitis]|uniref:Activator of HSP90 ATPase n=1 Tax=Paenibacillus nasutitermitis TaxID=1652958 RepID=A0A916ZH92_9BACL|nr:SRPBCC family protein [Paenibacillus nasutitermitis]GGD97403.1 activator of HSP90 ATPase [Paenibacillus nasutitermitis]